MGAEEGENPLTQPLPQGERNITAATKATLQWDLKGAEEGEIPIT